jgi:hypothetical protein
MKLHRFAPIALVGLAACGALFNGGPANVSFNSNPSGAKVLIDNVERGTTPTTIALAKNRNYNVTFRLAGYQDQNMEITKKVSGGYVILDILGGILPVVIDAATGSWYTLSTKEVNATLTQSVADATIESRGQLNAEQLAAVRMGTPASRVITAEMLAAGRVAN